MERLSVNECRCAQPPPAALLCPLGGAGGRWGEESWTCGRGRPGAGEGRGGRVSESGWRPVGLPPSPSSGGVGLPAAAGLASSDWLPGPGKLAHAIGPRSCKLSPYAGRRGRRGGARRFRPSPRPRAAEAGPAPLRNVAGSARWGAGTGGRAA